MCHKPFHGLFFPALGGCPGQPRGEEWGLGGRRSPHWNLPCPFPPFQINRNLLIVAALSTLPSPIAYFCLPSPPPSIRMIKGLARQPPPGLRSQLCLPTLPHYPVPGTHCPAGPLPTFPASPAWGPAATPAWGSPRGIRPPSPPKGGRRDTCGMTSPPTPTWP